MGQKRREERPEDGCPICSHARTKVWFGDRKCSNVQTQTLIDAARCSIGASGGSPSREDLSSKWRDPPSDAEVARCHETDVAVEQSGYADLDTRSCPRQVAKCQRCDVGSSGGSRPRTSGYQEKKVYLHLNLKSRESPQLVVCPKRNRSQCHSREGSRDTVIDVDSVSLPMPSHPPSRSRSRSRLSEPASSMSSYNTPRSGHRTPRDAFHELQSLRQAYGSGSLGEGLHRVTGELVTPRSSGRYPNPQSQVSRVVEEVIARDGHVDETLLPLPKWPHGLQHMSVGSSSKSAPRAELDSGALAKVVSARSTMVRREPMRVTGGSGTPPTEDVESATNQKEGVVLSWESLTVTSK